jgi:alkylated DNA nucleotide flippase Atl1
VAGKAGACTAAEGSQNPAQNAEALRDRYHAHPPPARRGRPNSQSATRQISDAEPAPRILARASQADVACPITTGIFVRIAAETAAEDARNGKVRITPYWRVIRDDGKLLEKLPGGPSAQAEHLAAEGHKIDRTGKLRVQGPGRALVRMLR